MAMIATATSTKELIEVWQQHCYFEFVKKDAEAALGTMSDAPHVLMVPLVIGGRGRDGVCRRH
jgi:carboxymethylenebutenolidase